MERFIRRVTLSSGTLSLPFKTVSWIRGKLGDLRGESKGFKEQIRNVGVLNYFTSDMCISTQEKDQSLKNVRILHPYKWIASIYFWHIIETCTFFMKIVIYSLYLLQYLLILHVPVKQRPPSVTGALKQYTVCGGRQTYLGMGEKMLSPARNFLMVPPALNQLCLFSCCALRNSLLRCFHCCEVNVLRILPR